VADVALLPIRPAGRSGATPTAEASSRLAELRAAGLVRQASEHTGPTGIDRLLPVVAQLRPLFPGGGLRRGSTVSIAPGPVPRGATSLLFGLLAEASAAGSWCGVVGLPDLGLVAAAQAGVEVSRLALVPNPGPEWVSVVAALLDGVDIVAVAPAGPVAPTVVSRLSARARQRGSILVPCGQWHGADLTVDVVGGAWHGLGQGRGRLSQHELEIVAYGRGAAARTRRVRWSAASKVTPPAALHSSAPLWTISAQPAGLDRDDDIELAG
jgi:hypothetical protein